MLKDHIVQVDPWLTKISSLGIIGLACGIYWFQSSYAPPFQPEPYSLLGKTIVITGATTGLGLESAKRLAAGGANVILTSRDHTKGRIAVGNVHSYMIETLASLKYNNQVITYKILDFDNLNDTKHQLIENWADVSEIDVLLNNAGIMALPERELTIDGFERQIQSNHLGHFVLCALLLPKLARNARIINVSSLAHRRTKKGLDFDNLWTADKYYRPWSVYSQTKLVNIMFTQEFQRRIDSYADLVGKNTKIASFKVIAVHPGVVVTDIGRYFFYSKWTRGLGSIIDTLFRILAKVGVFKNVEMGAATQVWLSSINTITDGMKGKYFVDCRESPVLVNIDRKDSVRLWEESEIKTRVQFNLVPTVE